MLRRFGWMLYLRALQRFDRLRLRRLVRNHPGLEIHQSASSNLACAKFRVDPGGSLRIGESVFTERLPGQLVFHVEAGATLEVGDGSWLRVEVESLRLTALAGARLEVGRDTWLSGCHLSATARIDVGDGAMIGPGTRVYDSWHAIDDERPGGSDPVRIGEFTWIASDVTVLPGVEIGGHCVIGARAAVTRSIPPHTMAAGVPAVPRGTVGKRRAFM